MNEVLNFVNEKTNDIPIFSNCNDAYFEILESEDKRNEFIVNAIKTFEKFMILFSELC